MQRKNLIGVVVISAIPFAAVAAGTGVDPSILVRSQEVLISPFPVAEATFRDPLNGQPVTAAWATLTGQRQRELLPNEKLAVQVSRINQTGGFSILPAQVTAERGNYEFNYRWIKYQVVLCNPQVPAAGHMWVGVGLDITVRATTRRTGLNVSGLGPFSAAAADDRLRGSLSVQSIGLGTNSAALIGFLKNTEISAQSAQDADKAVAVVKAVIENNDTKLTPHTLAVVERTPGACTGEVTKAFGNLVEGATVPTLLPAG
jgi:hypothetical protein